MSAILLLALCLGIGLAMARHERLPAGAPQALNFWIVNVALPALILVEIPKLHFSRELLFPALAPWLVFLGAVAIFGVIGPRRGWSRGTTGAMILNTLVDELHRRQRRTPRPAAGAVHLGRL